MKTYNDNYNNSDDDNDDDNDDNNWAAQVINDFDR